MSQENVEIVRRSIDAFNAGGLAAAAEFAHPDLVFEEPPTQPGSITAHGVENARKTLSAFDDTWEEHRTEVEELRDLGGDDVLTLTVEHLRGRDGVAFSQPCGSICTLAEGKIIRLRPFWDRSDALDAAGLQE
jgi:ketosteroid isomerase-like protein